MAGPRLPDRTAPAYRGGARSDVRLWRGRGTHERATIDAILDEALWATIAYTIDGEPFATPTQIWRRDDWIYWHGSAGSRMLHAVQAGPPVCVSAYLVDGLVLSRLASAHSINYRSVIAFGRPEPVVDEAEKLAQMRHYFERLFPGRWDETVPPTLRDMRRIIMVRMRIDEASAKLRKGPPGDGEALFPHAAWAGVLPIARAVGPPIPAPRLKAGLAEPSYLADFAARRQFGRLEPEVGDSPGRIAAEVVAIRDLTEQIKLFRLQPLAAAPPVAVEPGAHVKIEVVRDDGTLDWRSYSLVNAGSGEPFHEIAVRRDDAGAGGSRHLHARLALGSVVSLQPPAGAFALAPGARHVTLLAAGVGITPILPMAQALRRAGTSFTLHYGGRTLAGMAFLDEAAVAAGDGLTLHVSAGDAGRRMRPDVVIPEHQPGCQIAVCGPAELVRDAIAVARAKGYPEEAIRFELFSAPKAEGRSNRPVRLRLARSGAVLHVPADMPLLSAVLDAGYEVPHSCRRGECRQCACAVLAGEPDHRDVSLSADERAGSMCICVSRALTDELTLDL